MRIRDILYFAPTQKFSDLNFSDPARLVAALKDRVEGFYLRPARRLADADEAFGGGLICVALIDFIARYSSGSKNVRHRFTLWLETNIGDFAGKDPVDPRRTLGPRFYEDFRNGLVHEGRIKNLGQFSRDFPELLRLVGQGMVVNPAELIRRTGEAADRFCAAVIREPASLEKLKQRLRADFQAEIKASAK